MNYWTVCKWRAQELKLNILIEMQIIFDFQEKTNDVKIITKKIVKTEIIPEILIRKYVSKFIIPRI